MSSREVDLTEEEKLTLKAEGLPIPTTLPLTKVLYYVVNVDDIVLCMYITPDLYALLKLLFKLF